MKTILESIIEKKRDEVKELKEKGFKRFNQAHSSEHSLFKSLSNTNTLQVIAEIKRASPSKGDIKIEVNPIQQAIDYERAGACAISVLTDAPYFKGTMEDLANVRREVSLPILCKDFIIDKIQIERAKDAGATIILLIVAALEFEKLQELYNTAIGLELEVLVEVHNEEEMKIALELGAQIIGINNRNLKTFEVNLSVTESLGAKVQGREVVLISESGIQNIDDSSRVSRAGADGVLVGETLMRSNDLPGKLSSLKVSKGESK